MFGDGSPLIITPQNDLFNGFSNYMKGNRALKNKVGDIVVGIKNSLEKGEEKVIDMEISTEIEMEKNSRDITFFMERYSKVGGFQIKGVAKRNKAGDFYCQISYTWNDIMDPNFGYESDKDKNEFAKSIPGVTMEDYEVHITWEDAKKWADDFDIIKDNYPDYFNK